MFSLLAHWGPCGLGSPDFRLARYFKNLLVLYISVLKTDVTNHSCHKVAVRLPQNQSGCRYWWGYEHPDPCMARCRANWREFPTALVSVSTVTHVDGSGYGQRTGPFQKVGVPCPTPQCFHYDITSQRDLLSNVTSTDSHALGRLVLAFQPPAYCLDFTSTCKILVGTSILARV